MQQLYWHEQMNQPCWCTVLILCVQLDVVVATKSGKAMSRSMLHKQLVHKQMVDADQWARTLTAVLKKGNATVSHRNQLACKS